MTVEDCRRPGQRAARVAVCDHDVVYTGPTEGTGVLLIPGVEFSTEHGHLLGLFVRQPMVYTTWRRPPRLARRWGLTSCRPHPLSAPEGGRGNWCLWFPIWMDGDLNGRANWKNPQANAQAMAFAKDYG